MKNTKYAKLKKDATTGKQTLKYAPTSFTIPGKGVIGNPSKAEYLSAGWKEVVGTRPPERPKYHIVVDGYEETDEEIITLYNYEEDPVVPRHWTPLAVKRTVEQYALNEEGQTMWTLLRQLLVEMNYLEDFWGSQYIAEDDQAYLMVYPKACEKFGQEKIDKIIDEIPVDNR